MDDTDFQILLDTGASKCQMSKSFYLRSKSLHALPKFASNTQIIHIGNGEHVGVPFVILVNVDIHGHIFEVFALVSEIHENVDLVLQIKNIFELEVVDSQESCFIFMNRSIPFLSKEQVILKPKEHKLIIVDITFIEEIFGHGHSEDARYLRADYGHFKI